MSEQSDASVDALGEFPGVADHEMERAEVRMRQDEQREAALDRVSFPNVVKNFPSEYMDAKLKFWREAWKKRQLLGQPLHNFESFKNMLRVMHEVVFRSLAADTLIVRMADVDRASKIAERYKLAIDVIAEGLRPRRDGGRQLPPTEVADRLGQVMRARLEGLPDPFEVGKSATERGYDVDATREAEWGPLS